MPPWDDDLVAALGVADLPETIRREVVEVAGAELERRLALPTTHPVDGATWRRAQLREIARVLQARWGDLAAGSMASAHLARALVESSSSPPPIRIDAALLAEIGLGALPSEEVIPFLQHVVTHLELTVGKVLSTGMSDELLKEFEALLDAGDDEGGTRFSPASGPTTGPSSGSSSW